MRRNVTRTVLDNFYLDLGCCAYAAAMQSDSTHHLHGAYERSAADNRRRIAADREREERRNALRQVQTVQIKTF